MRRILASSTAASTVVAVVAALLLAGVLPLVIGALRPFPVRVGCIVAVAAIWGAIAVLRRRRAEKGSSAIAAALADAGATGGDRHDEAHAVASEMAAAMAAIKRTGGALDTKPWYLIVGPPGAGKTTALARSGLRSLAGDPAARGIGATRTVDFRVADQAVLIDTAGRYTLQVSDASTEARGWAGLLALLKRHRPRQPINGVVVAIGVDELAGAGLDTVDRLARAVRRRLAELSETLEVAPPVYVLLTKADLLAGFSEYFDDLDAKGRRAVLGATLPWQGGAEPTPAMAAAFDDLQAAIAARQPKRLLDESDLQRRALLLGFPAQIAALRPALLRFLDAAVPGQDGAFGMLRGFYMTSAVQQGTPLDRLLGGVAEVYERPLNGDAATRGRAYFLNRLFGDVIFPEAGLAASGAAAMPSRRIGTTGAIAALGAVGALVLAGWGVSYVRNRSFQHDILVDADAARQRIGDAGLDLREVRSTDPDLRAALPALDALRDLPGGYADTRRGPPPLTMRLGLYQAGLAEQAGASYREALRRVMMPRLLLRLEHILASASGEPARRALAAYLMLGGQRPIDKGAVTSFLVADWTDALYPGARNAGVRADLADHLSALLDDPNRASVWAGRRAPLDGPLIASVTAGAAPVATASSSAAPVGAVGPVAPYYAQNVLPTCRGAVQGRYPFFGAAAQDAPVTDVRAVFGTGGAMDGFILHQAMPLMDTGGPIWRWRPDTAQTATLDPQSPEEFSKAMQIRDLLAAGLPLKLSVTSYGADVVGADINASGTTDRFTRGGNEKKPLNWTIAGAPGAEIVLRGAGGEVARFKADGPWALFRLVDQANRENAGRQSFKASFGDGARSVTFLVELPSERNPFSRGGVWSFRCPTAL